MLYKYHEKGHEYRITWTECINLWRLIFFKELIALDIHMDFHHAIAYSFQKSFQDLVHKGKLREN